MTRSWENGQDRLTVRYTYLSEDESVLAENILLLQQELERKGLSYDAKVEKLEVPE